MQVVDVAFFDWLMTLGLTPRKSLTLGAVRVPARLFLDLVRGLLDGDGSVHTGMTTPNRRRYPYHTYQRLIVRFHSGSFDHVDWLRDRLASELGIEGYVAHQRKATSNLLWTLRYSKHDSRKLLAALYSSPAAPRLERKWRKWIEFEDHGKPTRRWTRHKDRVAMSSHRNTADI